jgi:hypothetical protein
MPTPTVGDFYANDVAFIGYGAQLLMGSAAGGASPDGSPDEDTYSVIGYVMSITPGDMSSNIIQATHLRSIGAHHEKIVGLRDSGPFSCELVWAPTEESQSNAGGGAGAFASGGLMDVWRNREERNFRIILPDTNATEWDFVGAVSKFQPSEIGLETLMTATVEITPLRDSTEFLP